MYEISIDCVENGVWKIVLIMCAITLNLIMTLITIYVFIFHGNDDVNGKCDVNDSDVNCDIDVKCDNVSDDVKSDVNFSCWPSEIQ